MSLDISLDDQVKQAKIARDLAESEAFRAAALRDHHAAEYNRHLAATQQQMAAYQAGYTAKSLRDLQLMQASDIDHRVYHLIGIIDTEMTHDCMEYLARWSRLSAEPVGIVLSTFGGSAFAGMALADHILALRERQGIQVTITVRGTAASMGAILLQTADKRVVGPGSTLLIHKVQGQTSGSLDQMEDMSNWFKLVQERATDMFAERCASAPNATRPLTRRQIVTGMNRKDWSIGPPEAVELGLADEIG